MDSPRVVTYCSFSRDSQWLGLIILEGELDQEGATKELVRRFEGLRGLGLKTSVRREEDVQPRLFELMWANRGRWISAADARSIFMVSNPLVRQGGTIVR
jgi:hypothetical protein